MFAEVLQQLINAPQSLRVKRYIFHLEHPSKCLKLLTNELVNFRKYLLPLIHGVERLLRRRALRCELCHTSV